MPRDERQTRVELIDPAIHDCGWNEALIREENTPGGTDIIDGRPRKRKGRTDYLHKQAHPIQTRRAGRRH